MNDTTLQDNNFAWGDKKTFAPKISVLCIVLEVHHIILLGQKWRACYHKMGPVASIHLVLEKLKIILIENQTLRGLAGYIFTT